MTIVPGATLGPYEILGPIGSGGMGEVHRAKDRRLGRDVAIKVLGASMTASADARARFQREARAVSALSHPNICALYDVGQQGGLDYLVMELLDGQTLAARLSDAPGGTGLPMQEAVSIATDIAAALDHAHRHGIVHRDLKPGNVMLTRTGAKLLDFGLAKQQAAGPFDAAATATHSAALTAAAQVMGTLPYMSPEQMQGRPVDARTDVFAFGALFYEMVTGRRAFDADSSPGLIAAVMTGEPPPARTVRPNTPVVVERLIAGCLAKDPAERWQSARDIVLHLAAVSDTAESAPDARRAWPKSLVAAALAAGVFLGFGLGWTTWRWGRAEPAPQVVSLAIALPGQAALVPNRRPGGGSSVAISRDGRSVAYVSLRNGTQRLALRRLDRAEEVELPGTEGAVCPFFSPDGSWIAFFNGIDLKKVPVAGGAPVQICRAPPVPRGGVWAEDGTIYFSPDFARGLLRVPAAGGRPVDATTVDFASGESNHLLPDVLPGGDVLFYTSWQGGNFDAASVWSLSLRTGARQRVLESASSVRYVAPGYLVYSHGGTLLAVPFDPERLALRGAAVPVVDGVWHDPSTGTAHFAVAQNGTLVYVPGASVALPQRLVWADRRGNLEPWPVEANAYGAVRFSPDGNHLAVEILNDIYLYDLAGRRLSRMTRRGVNQYPVWTPDGRRITYTSSQGVTAPKLAWCDVEQDGQTELLTRDGGGQFPSSWSRDGTLAYTEVAIEDDTGTGFDVWLLRRGTPPTREAWIRTEFGESEAAFSPDGSALAYVSDETGRPEVYIRRYPAAGRSIPVSVEGGTEPVWSRGGDEIFFRNGRKYLSAPVTTTPTLAAGRPTLLFTASFTAMISMPGEPSYDVAIDGKRFVMVAPTGDTAFPSHLNVILNWTEKLKAVVPPRSR